MNEKASSVIQKANQERKRGQFGRALKRLEQGIAACPDELDLYLEAVDTCIEGGELVQATNFLKTVQEKFSQDREKVLQFVRDKLQTVHDPSLARCVVENAVKRRDLDLALALLENVPDHTIRELLNRAKTKALSLKSASAGGYTLRGEAVTNELVNAVLSVRLGNLNEAMATFVKMVEGKSVEARPLDPFLAALASKHAKSGRVRHARACALHAGGNEIDALHQLIDAAKLEPACAETCVEKIRSMLENTHHPGKVRRALAEAQLLKGALEDASQTLREYLAENPDNGREVIMLLRPFIDPANGLNACTWLAVEQALAIEQSSVALEILRSLQQRGKHGDEVYAWLETRSREGSLPTDVMIFHGGLALEKKDYERSVEILSAVCTKSPQDAPAVLTVIDRHRTAHPSIDALYVKYAPETAESEEGDSSDDGDFQMFDGNEFKLGSKAPAPSSSREESEKKPKDKPKPKFSTSPFSTPRNDIDDDDEATTRESANEKPFVDARELSFDEDGSLSGATEEDAMDITESHVDNVAQRLYTSGAATFFHIDDRENHDSAAPVAEAPAPVAPPAPAAADNIPAPPAAKPAPAEAPAREPFATRYERFTKGELSNYDVLMLLDEAVQDGRADEMHELLYFEPSSGTEYFARYYYQAEYHILRNRPLQALEIFARLDTPDLNDEQKRRVWYKIAVCQRMTNNFAGASTTLDRLVERFPDREDFARLKRRNQEQCLAEQSQEVTTLEKTSTLD